jgi:hypothetical protein
MLLLATHPSPFFEYLRIRFFINLTVSPLQERGLYIIIYPLLFQEKGTGDEVKGQEKKVGV